MKNILETMIQKIEIKNTKDIKKIIKIITDKKDKIIQEKEDTMMMT